MKTALKVQGDLNTTTQSFTLGKVDPILNCNLGGLTPGIAYDISLNDGDPYDTKFTANADGKVSFAISVEGGNKDWTLKIKGGKLECTYSLGTKNLDAKVYNVTRAVATSVEYGVNVIRLSQPGSLDYILQHFGLNESNWGLQNKFGLLKFKYTLSTSPGMGIALAPISTITINDGDGNTYTITDTRDNGYGGTLGFGTDFQFYVGMPPISNKTLTITYDPHNYQYTYVGTVADVTLAGGSVLDLGTVELVMTTN